MYEPLSLKLTERQFYRASRKYLMEKEKKCIDEEKKWLDEKNRLMKILAELYLTKNK